MLHVGQSLALTALALLLASAGAAAQPPAPHGVRAEAGDAASRERVAVVLRGSNRTIRGTLVALDAGELRLRVDGKPVALPLSQIVRADVEVRDSLKNGALLGAAYLVACAIWWCGQGLDEPVDLPLAIVANAAAGALAGAGIDALVYRRTPLYRAGTSARAAAPAAAVAFTIRF
jgi:hypothetical protein